MHPTTISLLGSLMLLGIAHADASEAVLIVTFNNIPDRVRRQNPDLAAARFRVQEAIGRMRQSGRHANPEMELGLAGNNSWQEGGVEIGILQRFPVTNRLQLEKEISATEIKAAEAEIREVERNLIAEARKGLVDVLAIREKRKLEKKQASLSESLAKFVGEAAAVGEISPMDAGQARLEAAKLANEIRLLDAAEAAAVGALKPLLGMKPSALLHVSGTLPPAEFPSGAVDPDHRPDYQAARLNADAAAQGIALEESRQYNDIEVGVFAGLERSEDAPDGFENEGIFGLRLKIPLPLNDRNTGNIDAARARFQRKKHEAAALARAIRHEAKTARDEMIEWEKLLRETTGTLIPLAAEQAALAETAYRDGQGDLQSVLRAREQQLEIALSKLEALRNFHLARVRFEAAIGR